MKIAVIGTGRVGLPVAVAFATLGWQTACYEKDDIRRKKIALGSPPFQDEGLGKPLANAVASGSLSVCPDILTAVADAQAVFIVVQVEEGINGMDVLVTTIRELPAAVLEECLIVIKSTVSPGTCDKLQREFNIRIAMNPEFLRQGRGFIDFMKPSRIVVGTEDMASKSLLKKIYKPIIEKYNPPYIETDLKSAEIAKLVANATLAVRISHINEVADLCKATDCDFSSVCNIVEADSRIGKNNLRPSIGFGGCCLPKDTKMLLNAASSCHSPMPVTKAALEFNEKRPENLANRILRKLPPSPVIALWGMGFKPGADDLNQSPAVVLANSLLQGGAKVHAYDPLIPIEERNQVGSVYWFDDLITALHRADGLVILYEMPERIQATKIAHFMEGKVLFDFSNMFQGSTECDVSQGRGRKIPPTSQLDSR